MEEDWIWNWEMVMGRLVGNELVIGVDLRNEVRGVWGIMFWDWWVSVVEKVGNRLLKMKKDWLIIVGGMESGNDLRGVRIRLVRLEVEDRVVYLVYVYFWSGWGSFEGRYFKRMYLSFVVFMRSNWGYLVEGDVVLVWIGEFGVLSEFGRGDVNYWENLMRYLKSIDVDFGYWVINLRKLKDDEKEMYCFVEDDWVMLVLDYRMKDMMELMRIGYE